MLKSSARIPLLIGGMKYIYNIQLYWRWDLGIKGYYTTKKKTKKYDTRITCWTAKCCKANDF